MSLEIIGRKTGDLREVFKFLFEKAKERFGCNPPQMLDWFCVAHDGGGQLVGCSGANIASETDLLLMKIYKIADHELANLQNKKNLSEIGRWSVIEPNYALPVLRGLIEFLQSRGVESALCEMKPGPARRASAYGLKFIPVEAELQLEAIDPTERDYYEQEPPKLYRLVFSQIAWK